jgi:DNA adenine methylase
MGGTISIVVVGKNIKLSGSPSRMPRLRATKSDALARVGERSHFRPFVKWAGGKAQLLEKMAPHFPPLFNRYFEPFLGGGAVFFHLARTRGDFRAVLSDSNRELVNAYVVLRDKPQELMEILEAKGAAFRAEPTKPKKALFFKRERSSRPDLNRDPIANAARFIFLNKTAYNGLYRVNRSGEFNVPYGDYPHAQFFERENIEGVSAILNREGVELLCGDYEGIVLGRAERGDFVYLDPPYYSELGRGFTAYNPSLFTEGDQGRLAQVFRALAARGCRVLLSNSDSPFVRELFSGEGYNFVTLEALRSINSKGSKRTGARELLIKNYFADRPARGPHCST